MGRYVFNLPDVGEGVAEAEIVAWHVAVGDRIKEDQNLADVMTDKATVEMTSPVDGVVTAIHGEPGSMLPVGSVLVELEVAGPGNASGRPATPSEVATLAPAPATVGASTSAQPPASLREPPVSAPVVASARATSPTTTPKRRFGEPPLAAPATRRRAHELGVPLQYVSGTGPAGRIMPEDLDGYLAVAGPSPGARPQGAEKHGVEDIPIIGLRRRVAEKMQEATRRIPHITYVEECDLTELESLRRDLNKHQDERQPKLTLLPFLMRALAQVLPDFPQINARYDDQAGVLHAYEGVHIGIATQTAAGLIVPVIQHVEARDIWDCARELTRLSSAVRDGSAKREELSGSTITLTSLGPLGGVVTTPIVNHPEVAIIGPNKLVDRPMVLGGRTTIRSMMNLSSSFDHRIVDGHEAARFIQRFKRLLEHPALIFMAPA